MTFINYNKGYMEDHPASCLAYDLRCLIAVVYYAFDNDGASIDMEGKSRDRHHP